ncbi:MAG: hypothetical protein M9886_03550 [Candidatus Nanopelagicales bacterium]|nr:hypothetical protein [Candidatus Nanopelagicales bacterium]
MPFIVSRAGAEGLTYEQTRRRSMTTPTRGVRNQPDEDTWKDQVRALALVLPPGAVFSHDTAAQLHKLPLPTLDGTPLDVTVASRSARGSRHAVRWHYSKLPLRTAHPGGLPATDLARTWLDLGSRLTLEWQVAVTDVVLQRIPATELHITGHRRGASTLAAALKLADSRSRSPRESLLRVNLLIEGAPAPVVNLDIVEQGVWLATGDLVWPEFRFIVEYDGADHAPLKQRHKDANTRADLSAAGWTVQPLTAIHFRHVQRTVTMILNRLRSKGWTG